MSAQGGRSTPEWVTFAISSLILLVVVGLLVSQVGAGDEPPDPVAVTAVAEIVERDGGFHVPVEVHNRGDRGAANVQVHAELAIADEQTTADQTIDFLGADERVRLVFVFAEDPADGTLDVGVGSFAAP